jgi:hypothetical protein
MTMVTEPYGLLDYLEPCNVFHFLQCVAPLRPVLAQRADIQWHHTKIHLTDHSQQTYEHSYHHSGIYHDCFTG